MTAIPWATPQGARRVRRTPRRRCGRRWPGNQQACTADEDLWVPKTWSKSCDQAIFVDLATDASVSSDAVMLKIDRFEQRFQRRGAVQGAVRPVLIVVGLVLAQDLPQMVLVPGEGAVQEFAAASPDPAFGDRVHAGRPHVAAHVADPGVGQDRVEGGGEVRSPVADHELDLVGADNAFTSCDL
jgi:hypothetical protein